MKKFLSLMILSVMVLSCFTMTAFANDEATVTYTASAPDSEGKFTLTVSTDISVSSVMATIKFDNTKVEPVLVDGVVEMTAALTGSDIQYDEERSEILAQTYSTGTAEAEAGAAAIVVSFKKIGKIADTDEVFTLVTESSDNYFYDDSYCGLYVANATSDYAVDYGTVNYSFVTSAIVDEEDEPEPDPDPVYTWGSATDVVADETGVTGTKVAVFGKVSGGAGKVLADNEYWVTFGQNTYYGKASTSAVTAWAIVIYDPNGTKVEAGRTYGYTAGMTGVPSWTGSVTASAVAAE